ncbi:sugar kinase [Streptomyces litchfieldiae]|uniref:Sugar kinase n=1 Tax=Streptomyces litchfieldiae TaxID=3075543 RepID=A0ABU2MQA4_9ACTN|nr:sugar kinase [Streptomyces sp. DSM 44938]MDT0343803.1 sugar kinase [Streptomyces sp. DSM 44938]
MVAIYATPIDAVCLGETMAQVTPEPGGRLDGRSAMTLRSAGAESNVAVNLARLGHRAAWCGRVGADPLGELVVGEVAAAGVDVSLVGRDERRPTGVYFKDPAPSGSSVYYYRAGSAAAAMGPETAASVVAARPRVVHLSGITPALSDGCRRLVEHLLLERPVSGAVVSFDVNHRPALWDGPAGPELLRLARAADVVFVGLDEAARLWPVATAEEVRELIGAPVCLVVKDGGTEATSFDGETVAREPAPPVDIVEPVGAGDAFAAGWLSGLLRGLGHAARLRLGHLVAGAALGSTGDHAPLPDEEEIRRRIGVPPQQWAAGPARAGEG